MERHEVVGRVAGAPGAADPTGPFGRRWVRPRPDARALRLDVVTGLVATALCLLGLELTRAAGMLPPSGAGRAEELAETALVALPLCFRRAAPVTSMLASSGAFLLLGLRAPASGAAFMVQLAFFLVLLSGSAWARDRRRADLAWVVIVLVMAVWLVVIYVDPASFPGVTGSTVALAALGILVNIVYFAGARLAGDSLWRAARGRAQLEAVAVALREEQERSARRAVLDERLRIARELHDVVAHHVSVAGVQAAGARRVLERAGGAGASTEGDRGSAALQRAGQALREVERSSRTAVAEMRSLLGVLRSPDDRPPEAERPDVVPDLPQPGLDRLPELVEEVRGRGLAVDLRVVGAPREVSATADASLYRLVQEALANVQRHSAAGSARVVVRWPERAAQQGGLVGGVDDVDDVDDVVDGRREEVEVEVLDDGPSLDGGGGCGLGHVGMRERAALAGGAVDIGPRPVGGYRVRARYPVGEARYPVGEAS